MADREQLIAELREEYWDPQFEVPRPRRPEVIQRDEDRMAAIRTQLADLGSDVEPRPAEFPTGPA